MVTRDSLYDPPVRVNAVLCATHGRVPVTREEWTTRLVSHNHTIDCPTCGEPADVERAEPASAAEILVRATLVAQEAHQGQNRKGGGPYLVHPLRVARDTAAVVARLSQQALDPYNPTQVVAAALVHDVIEDVAPAHRTAAVACIGAQLGEHVLRLAQQLTNPSKQCPAGTSRATKKAVDLAHFVDPARVDGPARLIKLIDRADNLRGLDAFDVAFGIRYCHESERLLEAILAGLDAGPWPRVAAATDVAVLHDLTALYRRALAEARDCLTSRHLAEQQVAEESDRD